jgi:hypothetical protein
MNSPNLVQIYDKSLASSRNKDSIFSKKPFESHQQFYSQENNYDCGPFSVLNVTAAYVADAHYHLNWHEIRNPHDFSRLVHKPFCNVPEGWQRSDVGNSQMTEVISVQLDFPSSETLPTPLYQVEFNEEDYTYLLHLRDGQIVTKDRWPPSICDLITTGYSLEKAGDQAEKLTAPDDARKAANIARELKTMEDFNLEEDPGRVGAKGKAVNNCFPITLQTGKVNGKKVSQILHLKFIPSHQLGEVIFKQVYQGHSYQGRSGDKLVDLINPNWVLWCFEQEFCYYVIHLGVQQWKTYGEKKRMSWIPVPLGASMDGN